jgi:hypothetical protein
MLKFLDGAGLARALSAVKSILNQKLNLSGGTLQGNLDLDGHDITGLQDIYGEGVHLDILTANDDGIIGVDSDMEMRNGKTLTGLPEPTDDDDAAPKSYVDDANALQPNRSELASVLTGATMAADGTAVTAVYATYNAVAKTAGTLNVTIPLASDTAAGAMTKEAYGAIQAMLADIAALQQQGGRFIGVSFATYADLAAWTTPASVNVGDFTYILDDETHDDARTRYIYTETDDGQGGTVRAWEFAYIIDYDPVGLATTETPGLVLGADDTTGNAGKVYIELDGTMSVIGWDALRGDVTALGSAVAAEQSRAEGVEGNLLTTVNGKQAKSPTDGKIYGLRDASLTDITKTLTDSIKKQGAITLTNPLQSEIDALDKYLTGALVINITQNMSNLTLAGFVTNRNSAITINISAGVTLGTFTATYITGGLYLTASTGTITTATISGVSWLQVSCNVGTLSASGTHIIGTSTAGATLANVSLTGAAYLSCAGNTKFTTITISQSSIVYILSAFTGTITTINNTGGAVVDKRTAPLASSLSTLAQVNTKKRFETIVIGSTGAGYTAADVDYLCDGTNDSTQFAAAHTALPTEGGEIKILNGTYKLTKPWAITKGNVVVRGSGYINTHIQMNGARNDTVNAEAAQATNAVIYVSGSSNTISDITVTHDTLTSGRSYGIYLNCSYLTIERVRFTNKVSGGSGCYGAYAVAGSWNTVRDCAIQVSCTGDLTGSITGLFSNESTSNNLIYDNRVAMTLTGTTTEALCGISTRGAGSIITDNKVVLTSNTATNAVIGILLLHGNTLRNLDVSNNVLEAAGTKGTGSIGISLGGGAIRAAINGNVICGLFETGVKLNSGSTVNCIGNVISSTSTIAFYISVTYSNISNNVVAGGTELSGVAKFVFRLVSATANSKTTITNNNCVAWIAQGAKLITFDGTTEQTAVGSATTIATGGAIGTGTMGFNMV